MRVSVEQEKKVGEEEAKKVETQMGLLKEQIAVVNNLA